QISCARSHCESAARPARRSPARSPSGPSRNLGRKRSATWIQSPTTEPVGKLKARTRSLQNHWQGFVGQAGLTGAPLCNQTHTATPPTTPNPPAIAAVELMIPPPDPTAAPAARFFLFFFSVSLVSSRVVCWPCVTVVVPLSSCTVTSPLLAAICTRPSTSVT